MAYKDPGLPLKDMPRTGFTGIFSLLSLIFA